MPRVSRKKPGKPGFFCLPVVPIHGRPRGACYTPATPTDDSPDADSAPARLRPVPCIDRLVVHTRCGRRKKEKVLAEESGNEPGLQRFLCAGELGLAQGQR